MMRIPSIAAALLPLVANLHVCGGDSADPHDTSAKTNTSAQVQAPAPTAKHGGTIVALGSTHLEVIVKADGQVQAFPTDPVATAGGTAVVSVVPPTAAVTVQVPTVEARPAPVELVWSPATASFEGRVVGAPVRPGPVEVTVTNAGPAPLRGRIEAAPLVVVPTRGGTIVDVGPAKMEVVVASSGTVQAYPIFPTVASVEAIPPQAEVTVEVPTTDEVRPVTLAWNGPIASFEGRAENVVFRPGPMSVRVVRGPQRIEARAPTFVVQPPSAVVVTGPQHGGTLVDVEGGHKVEVVVADNGDVQAYPVVSYVGAPMMPPNAEVTVEVPVEAGPPRPVPLRWSAEGHFGGEVRGAVVRPGPVNVVVVHGGVRRRGVAPSVVIVAAPPPPPPAPRGRVRVVAAPPPPPRGNVMVHGQAPGVRVQATVPSVRVNVQAPGVTVTRPGWRSPRR